MEYVTIEAKKKNPENVRNFYTAYSTIAGRVKQLPSLTGDDRDNAEKQLLTAVTAMQELDKLLPSKKKK